MKETLGELLAWKMDPSNRVRQIGHSDAPRSIAFFRFSLPSLAPVVPDGSENNGKKLKAQS